MGPDVVVVGSGYAGTAAVAEFESLDAAVDLTWISRDAEHVVRHEMHRLIREPTLYDALRIPVDRVRTAATEFVEGTVTGIDLEERTLRLADGRIVSYDYLLLTVGARPAYYGIPGLKAHALPMDTIEDAQSIHERIDEAFDTAGPDRPARIVVGGGGLTGVQTAGEIAAYAEERSANAAITVVEALDTVLPAAPAPLQDRVRERLVAAGVTIEAASPIVEATPEEVVLDPEEHRPYDILLWTGGITGRDFVLDTDLAEERHRLQVDATLSTSDERVFSVGDIALIEQPDGYAPPTAQAAWQAAPVAARNVLAAARDQRPESWLYDDKGTLVSIGDDAIAHDVVGIPIDTFDGLPAQTLKKLVACRWIASLTSWRSAMRLWPYL